MSSIEVLDWRGLSDFYYEGMVKKDEIADGSCFFHCIADSFYKPYQLGTIDRKDFVRKLRKDLSLRLDSEYSSLSRGKLREYSRELQDFSLSNLKRQLDSYEFVDNRFNELVSNILNKDIYILDYEKRDVYITGNDDEILYKNRESIVIIWYNQNHFDLVGIIEDDKLITLFKPNHPFIINIKDRMKQLRIQTNK